MKDPHYYEMTDYPNLYKCYWGCFRKSSGMAGEHIFKARNVFAKYHGINRAHTPARLIEFICERPWSHGEGEVDHAEFYKLDNGMLVFICSNYNSPPPAFMEMKECERLYSDSCITYMRMFYNTPDMIRKVNGWAKEIRNKVVLA